MVADHQGGRHQGGVRFVTATLTSGFGTLRPFRNVRCLEVRFRAMSDIGQHFMLQ
jgi:hypothetical protein